MESAYEWGVRHDSCESALEQRKKYPNQPEWYKACDRGDWLFWQLQHAQLTDEHVEIIIRLAMDFAIHAVKEYAVGCGIKLVEEWAAKFISGDDRSEEAAWAAAWAARAAAWEAAEVARAAGAAWAAARAAEAAGAAEAARAAAGAARAAWTVARAAGAAIEAAIEAAWTAAGAAIEAAEAARAARAARAVARAAIEAAELKRQADEIHKLIPEWPGDKV